MGRKALAFKLDPAKPGLRMILGDLEHDIMVLLWRCGESTVRQVHAQLGKRREIAYTTVMTVMSRLETKGLLLRSRVGRAFVYKPAHTREEFTQSSLRRVFSGLLRDLSTHAIHEFVASMGEHRPADLAALARLVDAARRKTHA